MKNVHRLLFVSGLGAIVIGWLLALPVPSAPPLPNHQPRYGSTDVFQSRPINRRISFAPVRGVIVNHHLVGARFIAETLSYINWQHIDRVIVLSPNHFQAGRGWVITGNNDWLVPNGRMKVDRPAVAELGRAGVVVDDLSIDGDHGLYNVMPFIKKFDRSVRVIPLLVRDQMPDEELRRVEAALLRIIDRGTLVVGSFDFSHDSSSSVAQERDEVSLNIIERLATAEVAKVSVDSIPGVSLTMRLMRGVGASRFHLVGHSNSAILTGHVESKEATSYIAGFFTSPSSRAYTTTSFIH